jgi:hypothetical protein
MAGLGVSLYAQTPPATPNLQLTLLPDLAYNVWPADFDRDGRADLVAATATGSLQARLPADLVIRIGRGDGTFLPDRSLGRAALPLGVGDFNADGFADIVIREGDAIAVLPGRAGATFGAPRSVGPTNYPRQEVRVWADVADFDGDGRRDILVPEMPDTLKLYRGNGDLTFQPAVELFTQGGGYQPADATSGDFNGDGRRDFAVASPIEIDVFINTGGVSFSGTVIPGAEFTDITTRDLNNDGRLDLIASSGSFDFHYPYTTPGAVHVLLGNGNGTFQPPLRHETGVLGSMSVVVGEFTGDGILDVATGNRSVVDDEDLGRLFWDSLSVFPGDGKGGLAAPTTYALGDVQPEYGWFDQNNPFRDAHHQLNTADLNGDGRTDLIASPGVIALNRAAAPNRTPVAFAGPDRTAYEFDASRFFLRGQGTDPDMHWLTYEWRDEAGRLLNAPWTSAAGVYQDRGTTKTYTLTVNDGHGGVSSDTVTIYVPFETDPWVEIGFSGSVFDAPVVGEPHTIVWTIQDPEGVLTSASISYSLDDGRTFTALPGCQNLPPRSGQCVWQNPGPVTDVVRFRIIATSSARQFIRVTSRLSILPSPGGWDSADVGAVGAAGTTAYSGGGWTVEGSGADIWGTADEFRYVYRVVSGSFSITTRVASIENLDRWVKAGLMIRESLAPGSRHVSLFATPRTERGLAFQRRLQTGGISVHTAGPAVAPPGWLTLGRVGDTISAYYRASATDAWTLVGRETIAGLPEQVLVGLAVTSHVDGTLATARFDNVTVETGLLDASQDVGAVGVAGSASFDGIFYDVRASGRDIWGTADSFRIVHQGPPISGPTTEITARVRSLDNTYPWAKAGVMFRQSPLNAQSPYVTVVVTPGRGVAMQYRVEQGKPSAQVAVRAGIAPEWVRLSQVEGVFRGYASEDGMTWHLIGEVRLDWFGAPALAVTSHDNAVLTRAVFENVRLRGVLSQ